MYIYLYQVRTVRIVPEPEGSVKRCTARQVNRRDEHLGHAARPGPPPPPRRCVSVRSDGTRGLHPAGPLPPSRSSSIMSQLSTSVMARATESLPRICCRDAPARATAFPYRATALLRLRQGPAL